MNEEKPQQESSQKEQEEQIKAQIEVLKSQLPKKQKKVIKLPVAITEEEFSKLMEHTKQKHHKLAFLLGFASGLRISEVINLEPRHLIIKEGKILIEQGKGSKDRIVPLPKRFPTEYLNYLPIKCGKRALEKAFKSCCEGAGLLKIKPTLHFHSLRHGFATQCIQKGMQIHNLKLLMGHTNISTTNVYLNANPQDALKSYEEFF